MRHLLGLELKIGQNLNAPQGFYRWLKLTPVPGSACEVHIIGKEPPGISFLDEFDYSTALGIDPRYEIPDILFEAAIAPGQPFLVLMKPTFHRDYWGEVDIDWDTEVLRVVPYPKERALKAWERILGDDAREVSAALQSIQRGLRADQLDR